MSRGAPGPASAGFRAHAHGRYFGGVAERDFGKCVQLFIRMLTASPTREIYTWQLTTTMQAAILYPDRPELLCDPMAARAALGPNWTYGKWGMDLDKEQWRLWPWADPEQVDEVRAALRWMVKAGLLVRLFQEPREDRPGKEVIRLTDAARRDAPRLLDQDLHIGGPESPLGALVLAGPGAAGRAWTARRRERSEHREHRRARAGGAGAAGPEFDLAAPRGGRAWIRSRIARGGARRWPRRT